MTPEARLALYLDAEALILSGQEVRMDGRALVRADLQFVQAQIERLQAQVNAAKRLEAGLGGFSRSFADFSGRCR